MLDGEGPKATIVVRRGDVEVARWEVDDDGRPDLATVDEIARTALAARRMGGTILVTDPSPRLRELLQLVGLAGMVAEPR